MDADDGPAGLPIQIGGGETGPEPSRRTAGGYTPETRFGRWFLNTQIWSDRVLKVAVDDLRGMMAHPDAAWPLILDVGCGHGRSLPLLMEAFRPGRLIAIDRERKVLANAQPRATKIGPAVTLVLGDCSRLPVRDGVVDLIFCHQLLHHMVDQMDAVREFHRVLRPGGVLLLAELTRTYIDTWMIRWLFRHPMNVQRSADEFLAMLRTGGFAIAPDGVSFPYTWWSRADLGAIERFLRIPPPNPGQREETLVNVVAVKRDPE